MKKLSLRRLTWSLVILTAIAGMIGVGSAAWVADRIAKSTEAWHAYRDASSIRATALADISKHLGYNGAIHHLENYILRSDYRLIARLDNALGATQSAVERYRVASLSAVEAAALDTIENTIREMRAQGDIVQRMKAYGKPTSDIAATVSIDIGPTAAALTTLNEAVAARRASRTDQISKLELLHQLRSSIGFGGMIHKFKRMILNRDSTLGPDITAEITNTSHTLRRYRAFELTPDEVVALDTIQAMLEDYDLNTDEALRGLAAGDSSIRIDDMVKIDDQPAIAGFTVLEKAIQQSASGLTRSISDTLHFMARMSTGLAITYAVSAIAVCLLLALILIRLVQSPLSRISGSVARVTSGDVTAEERVDSPISEIATLGEAVETLRRHAGELGRGAVTLQQFISLSTDVSRSTAGRIEEILEYGLDYFGMDLGTASCTRDGRYVVDYSVGKGQRRPRGTAFDLEKTYCWHALDRNGPVAYHNVPQSEIADALCYRTFGRKAYIGAPVTVNGEIYGTVNFSSIEPRETPFSPGDLVFVELIARWFGMELEREFSIKALETAKRAAEDATREKSGFLANMSHEIRTPLNGVIGLSRLLSQTELTAKQHDYVRKIIASSDNLLGILNDILDFSKIEAGQLSIEETSFRLLDVLDNVSAMVAPKAAEKGLEFLLSVDPNTPQDLLGDPLRLGQIITNLSTNAVKFTEKGEIVVTVTANEVDDKTAELQFSVRDTGVGMTEEQQARIFRPFTQADITTTRRFGGTGLGLSISKEFVERMGGRIWVETEPEVGSTFHFTIRLKMASGAVQDRFVIPEDLTDLRILVVDDNEMARIVIADTLRSMGFAVDVVETGVRALEVLKVDDENLSHDVVILDWIMPDLDGIDTARRISERRGPRERPVMLLTSAHPPAEGDALLNEAGIADFIAKPVNQSSLLNALLGAIAGDRTVAYARSGALTASPVSLEGLTVLLAEDHPINIEIAMAVLGREGIEVEVVENGQLAVDAVFSRKSDHYDAVLMDVQMPVMDGLDATRLIRKDPRFADLPVIAMTAHATEEGREACRAAGMRDHVSKPLDDQQLYAALAKHCRAGKAPDTFPADEDLERPMTQESTDIDLKQIPGINYDGLMEMLGDEELACHLIRSFRESHGDAAAAIGSEIENGNLEAARRSVHQIRGVAGNLRITGVFDAADTLEDSIEKSGLNGGRASEEIMLAFKSLEAALKELCAAMDQAGKPGTAPPAPAQPSAAPPPVDRVPEEGLRDLIDKLRSGDMNAEDRWRSLEPAIRSGAPDTASTVGSLILNLDYEAAADRLEGILADSSPHGS